MFLSSVFAWIPIPSHQFVKTLHCVVVVVAGHYLVSCGGFPNTPTRTTATDSIFSLLCHILNSFC